MRLLLKSRGHILTLFHVLQHQALVDELFKMPSDPLALNIFMAVELYQHQQTELENTKKKKGLILKKNYSPPKPKSLKSNLSSCYEEMINQCIKILLKITLH